MLKGLRKAGQSLVGKIVATVLFGILIISFAIWGIGDIFRGAPRNTVATVGRSEISADRFRTAYQNEIQRLSRQFRRPITPEQARAFGIDQQVLSRLLTETTFDEKRRELGLSVSDQLVARSIMEDPTFRNAGGQFNRALFEEVLRNNGLSEAGFVREQHDALTRLHLVEALTGALPVPIAAREAIHRYGAERRSAAYLVLPPAAAGEVPAPTAEQLQTFYNERKAGFRTPEYRALNIVSLNAEALAKPESVSDQDARQRYEQMKSRFGTPERRTIQQIVFPSQEEAETAFNRLKEGAGFEAIAAERGISNQDLELGTFTKAEMLDSAVADAAFSLQEGAVSGPVQGRFGSVLVRVTKVQPESVRPYEEVAGEVRREIAVERARTEIEAMHDAIEDQRAGARPLPEVAREKGLPLIQVPAVDRTGHDKSGQIVETIPERDAVLAAAFASDIGVDDEPVRARNGGYVWYEVTNIEASREKALDEVRADVESQWRSDEIARRLSDKARQLVERLDKGESIETLAAELGVQAKTAADLSRNVAKEDLGADVVTRIFAVPVGKSGSAAAGADSRAVFKVSSATVPPFVTTTRDAQRVEDQLRLVLSDDLISEYVAQAQRDVGARVNEQAIRRVVGGEL